MRIIMLFNYLKFLFLVLTLAACSDIQETKTYQLSGNTMGTTYNITVVGEHRVDPALVTTALEAIENSMSSYRPDSELMRLNQAPINTWITISQALYDVLKISEEVSLLSEGAFDITVAPLVNLWSFGPDKTNFGSPPDNADEIQEAMKNTGYQHLELADNRAAVFKKRMLSLDLSAVAKGYAVDVIAGLLESNNIANYLVEIGGEIKTRGNNSLGDAWRIAIELPERMSVNRQAVRTIHINDASVASSGDYRNFYEMEGKFYSHTLDPRSGYPITHNLASVTVLAGSTAQADALATAFNVLGTEQALQLAERDGIPAYFLEHTEGGFVECYSSTFIDFID